MPLNSRHTLDLSLVAPALGAWGITLAALAGLSPAQLTLLTLSLAAATSYQANQHYRRRPRHAQPHTGSPWLLGALSLTILSLTAVNAHLHYQHYQRTEISSHCLVHCEIEVIAARPPVATERGYLLRATLGTASNQQILLSGKELGHVKTNDRLQVSGKLTPQNAPPNLGIFTVRQHRTTETSFAHAVATQLEAATGHRENAALVRGMTIGDISGLSPQTRNQIRAAGVSHLVAISGLHLAIVLGMLHRLLPGRPRHKLLATWVGLTLVVLSVGGQPSIIRAATMLGIVTVGIYLRRHSQGVNSLGLVILIWLIYDPWLARSTGFLLSVVATLAVLGVSISAQRIEHFEVETRARQYWLAARPVLLVPLSAQLATSAVTVTQLGSFSTYGVFTNLLLTPAVPLLTGGGVVVLLVSFISLPAAQLLAQPLEVLAQVCLDFIALVASLPGAYLEGTAAWWALGIQYLLVGGGFICGRGVRSYLHGSKTKVFEKTRR